MFAISEGTHCIGGIEVPTYKREVVSANILEVEAGTNGYQGGDGGHGSRTYFRIKMAARALRSRLAATVSLKQSSRRSSSSQRCWRMAQRRCTTDVHPV